MKSLYETLTAGRLFQQRKHNLSDDYVRNGINSLTNDELLQEISDALEGMRTETGATKEQP